MKTNPLLCLLMIALTQTTLAQSSKDSLPYKDSIAVDDAKLAVANNIPMIMLDDNELKEQGAQNISSLLSASRDPFLTTAAFNFSATRFRLRGYDGDMQRLYINSIPMNNLDNGYAPTSFWGGLNDVFRNRETMPGLSPGSFSFGSIGTATNIDIRAAKQRKQTSIGYALSNRAYTHRFAITHNTGFIKHGWALSFSLSRRYASEGYVPGTYYNGWSYFAGIDKKIGSQHLLSLVAFGAPTESGGSSAATAEIQELAATHYYNPNWGYQQGRKRNAVVSRSHQPYLILHHEYRVTNKTLLTTAVSYSTGTRSITGLDWLNAPDPRPDYYRYLPSYYNDDSAQYLQLKQLLQNDESRRQINWQRFYDVNRGSFEVISNANGIPGNDVSGKLSRYVLQERVTASQRIHFNTTINANIGEHLQLSGGISYQQQINHYYKVLNDLLGGEFYLDINQFAQTNDPGDVNVIQNDLNNPNHIVYVNDKFGYNYHLYITKATEWAQTTIHLNHFDFFIGGEASYTSFYRTGHMRNGLFPDNSFGKSSLHQFLNYGLKAGFTYKLNGRNYFFANAVKQTKAPYPDNVYISPRTRDIVQDNIQSETIQSIEAGYTLHAPKYKLSLRGYYTTIDDGMNVLSFYHDDFRSFVNYALSGINKLYYGGELGFEFSPFKNISFNGAATAGRSYYNSRQNATVTADNSVTLLDKTTLYTKNFRLPISPQQAYALGWVYRLQNSLLMNITASYFSNSWLDFNPVRRSARAVEGLDKTSSLYHSIVDQEKLPDQYSVDFFCTYQWRLPKSLRIKKNTVIVFNAGISNLLDNKDMVVFGYEQLRFNYTDKNVNSFPPKRSYGIGRNYFLSSTIRF